MNGAGRVNSLKAWLDQKIDEYYGIEYIHGDEADRKPHDSVGKSLGLTDQEIVGHWEMVSTHYPRVTKVQGEKMFPATVARFKRFLAATLTYEICPIVPVSGESFPDRFEFVGLDEFMEWEELENEGMEDDGQDVEVQ